MRVLKISSLSRPLATGLVAAGALLLATPSLAATWKVECLWNNIPEAARTTYVKDWTQDSSVRTLMAQFKQDPASGCGVPTEERPQAALGLLVYADRQGALGALQTHFDRPAARVFEAWNSTPQADRKTFSADMAAHTDDTPEHQALYRRLVLAFATKLDLVKEDAAPAASIFVRSQGLLDSIGHGAVAAN
jgi:hypothetical protein